MTSVRDIIREGGAKGLPRSMKAFYDALDSAGAFQDHIQVAVNYPSSVFTTGSDPQFLSVAPWDGEILGFALVNQSTITGSQSVVDFDIVGGASNPIAQLDTQGNTLGEIDTITFATPVPILQDQAIRGQSDGNAAGISTVMLFVSMRSL